MNEKTFLYILFTLTSVSLFSQHFGGELWINEEIQPFPHTGEEIDKIIRSSDSNREIIQELLADARWIISGMLYGFNVNWKPGIISGSIKDLIIEPIGLIPWGDPKLNVSAIVRENGLLYFQMDYDPDSLQRNRQSYWQSNNLPVAVGMGKSHILDNGSRRKAMETAVKEAIRNWLRARVYNRPQLVKGRVALTEFPAIGFSDGNYMANVNIAMEIESIPVDY